MEARECQRYYDAVDASYNLARKVGIAEGIFLGGGFLVSQGTLLAGTRRVCTSRLFKMDSDGLCDHVYIHCLLACLSWILFCLESVG